MRILLLGADGQVGFELHRALAPLGQLLPATRSGVLPGGLVCLRGDLHDFESLAGLIRDVRPAWIVNAAAYTAVDRAEDDYDSALAVNGEALGVIGAEAMKLNAAVVHFSTDYVFPGSGVRPYREDDPTGPVNAYGRSKLEGEHSLRASGCRHLLLRCSWVYGSRGKNFLRTMLRLARARDSLTVVNDQRGAPTSARLIASAVAAMLVRIAAAPVQARLMGTYHLAASGETTWHGFASEIVALAARAGLVPRSIAVDPISTRDYITRAARPHYSMLDCGKLTRHFGLELPDWREGLERCIAELADQDEQRLGSVMGA